MRGDFVLYKAKPGAFIDWLISHFTRGPYIHVEIDLGDGNFVGEHGSGITVHPRDNDIPANFVTPKSKEGQKGIDTGMQWVEAVIEKVKKAPKDYKYGWLDIVADATKILGAKITFRKSNAWDCSHFVTLYLQVADADWPLGNLTQNPDTVSPNDLARAYGVIK